MNKDYDKGFKDAIKQVNKLLVSEMKVYKNELKKLEKDKDYLRAHENKLMVQDLEFYIHALEQIKNGKEDFAFGGSCNCLICKGE